MNAAATPGIAFRRIGIATAVWATIFAVSFAAPLASDAANAFAIAITLDFAIVAPLIIYLIWMREKRAPLLSMAPLFIVGCLLAMAVLPKDQQGAVETIRLLAIPLEVLVVLCIAVLARRAYRASRAADQDDFVDRIRDAAQQVVHSRLVADILATELCLLRFAFSGRSRTKKSGGRFEHELGVTRPIVIAFMAIIVIETVAVHLLLARWSPLAAWFATALSVYAAIWLAGDYRALLRRRTEIVGHSLRFCLGLRFEAMIPLSNISAIESCRTFEKSKDAIKATAMQEPNLVLRFAEPVEVTGMYGVRRKATALFIRAAHPKQVRAALMAPDDADVPRAD